MSGDSFHVLPTTSEQIHTNSKVSPLNTYFHLLLRRHLQKLTDDALYASVTDINNKRSMPKKKSFPISQDLEESYPFYTKRPPRNNLHPSPPLTDPPTMVTEISLPSTRLSSSSSSFFPLPSSPLRHHLTLGCIHLQASSFATCYHIQILFRSAT